MWNITYLQYRNLKYEIHVFIIWNIAYFESTQYMLFEPRVDRESMSLRAQSAHTPSVLTST